MEFKTYFESNDIIIFKSHFVTYKNIDTVLDNINDDIIRHPNINISKLTLYNDKQAELSEHSLKICGYFDINDLYVFIKRLLYFYVMR